jgi:hypothetical protein
MFSIFKHDAIKKLNKRYENKLEEIMHVQQKGDIKSYVMITAEADSIKLEIIKLQESTKNITLE